MELVSGQLLLRAGCAPFWPTTIWSIRLQEERVLVSFTRRHMSNVDLNIAGCRFDQKKCCLPVGGPPSPPSPPSGKQCPPKAWSWNDEHSCCVPHQPPVTSQPPQCDNDWAWAAEDMCCKQSYGHPSPPPSRSGCKDSEFW